MNCFFTCNKHVPIYSHCIIIVEFPSITSTSCVMMCKLTEIEYYMFPIQTCFLQTLV